MKVGLYRKWIWLVRRRISERGYGSYFGARMPLRGRNSLLYGVAAGVWRNYDSWCTGQYEYLSEDVSSFREKYKRYSRRYWVPELVLARAAKGIPA